MSPPADPTVAWLTELLGDLPNLRERQRPRPYYSQRDGRPGNDKLSSLTSIVKRVRSVISEFDEQHFFARELGFECVDGNGESRTTIEHELEWRVGKPHLLRVQDDGWSAEDLYDVVEVYHDLAARPTSGWFHSYGGCGLHPSSFHVGSGRTLFRWRINGVLAATSLGVRLADDGEDVGRIVTLPPAGLEELTATVLAASVPGEADEAIHAIALFRERGASRETRRSAIVTLARVLEDRRKLLKQHLVTGDEGALFEIANRFDLRHKKADQKGDYSDEFLEWIFYWYLATVQLTDRLVQRSGSPPP